MPGPTRSRKLVEAMIRSGEKAAAHFCQISGGEWFDEAPEYFLSTYVARSAGNHENTGLPQSWWVD